MTNCRLYLGLGCLMLIAWRIHFINVSAHAADPPRHEPGFDKRVLPVLTKYCTECHGAKKQNAGVAFHQVQSPDDVLKDRGTWESVLQRVRDKEMPPKSKPQPSADERTALVHWLEAELSSALCTGPPNPGKVTLRRLNRAEYANTIRDLFGIDVQPAEGFPLDDVGYGFDNIGDVLTLSPLLLEKYLTAADAVLEKVFAKEARVRTSNRIYQAREREFAVTGRNTVLPEDQGRLIVGGEMTRKYVAEHPGEYSFKMRALGQPLFGENPKLSFRVDGKELKSIEVPPPKEEDGKKPPHRRAHTFEVKTTLKAGEHRFGFEFLNPKSDPKQSDVKLKERTVHVVGFEIVGPLNPPLPEPTDAYRQLMIAKPVNGVTTVQAAQKILGAFARRAFRRPPTDAEIARLVGLVQQAEKQGDGFDLGIEVALKAILVSPSFLFKVENDPPGAAGGQAYAINNWELATRLSYFLWSSLPDDELLRLAEAGTLRQPEVLRRQVDRMLKDAKSKALGDNFAGQWLQTRNLRIVDIDSGAFPHFDEALRSAMKEETAQFFAAIVREDRLLLDLLEANFTYVNERLAKLYGIKDVKGPEFRRVSLKGTHRAGVLTHASVLTVTSNPTRTSPVKRGKFILENILGATIPPPPPDVPDLEDGRELKGTLRQRLEQHRTNPTCASCHDRMDPPGLAFENFDGVGAWRDQDDGKPIDTSGKLTDGQEFGNVEDFRRILKERRDAFRKTLADRLLTYALGRGLEPADRCVLDELCKKTVEGGDRFSALVRAIVMSDPFQKRNAKGTP